MKKKFLTSLFIISCLGFIQHSSAQSPEWLWAKGTDCSNYIYGFSVAIDTAGNGDVYTTGHFSGTADFDPGPDSFNLTSTGWRDMFISKLDNSGNFVWAIRIGESTNTYGESIAIDASGNVYTTGSFATTVDFDPGAGVFNLTSVYGSDIYILKLDSAGNFIWAKQMSGPGGEDGYSIAIDHSGNGDVYITGAFQSTVDFDPGPGVFNLYSGGESDIFICKLDSSGNFKWAKSMEGADDDYGYAIAVDPAGSGNVYTTGFFGGTVDFNPGGGVFNLTSVAGSDDIFISKLDSAGNFIWAKAMGGVDYDNGYSLAVDPAGSGCVYITGEFQNTADFDPGAGIYNLTPVGGYDIFISKLDGSGNFVWAKAIGGIANDKGISITLDPSGNGSVYTTGMFVDTADFDPDSIGSFILTSAGSNYAFISKLDSLGNFIWAKSAGGDYSKSIAVDNFGNITLTGFYSSSVAVFGSDTLSNTTLFGSDMFVARLFDSTAATTGNNEIVNDDRRVLVFPNPVTRITTISFSLEKSQNVSLKIFDVNGRMIAKLADKKFGEGKNEIVWNVEELNAGFYFLRVVTEGFSRTEKISLVK